MLSEHVCQGLLEGYLLTGRHGVFTCYEAFIHIVDSMFNQHAKWLQACAEIEWRRPIPSLNYLLSSHVWRQDHNGATHQDPGFLDVVLNKKPHLVRVYLPPDTNTLLSVYDHCLRSRNYINVVVAGKQPQLDYLSMDDAVLHCSRGIGVWDWAGTEQPGTEPDVVLACAGEIPTLETLAAADLLRRELPDLKVRVVNVVDLMRLQPESEHPHGLPDREFDALFTTDKPVIFAFHGYPWLVHRLAYRRTNHANLHVRGFKENGTTTTPFDMVMLNDLDRFHLVLDVIDRVPGPRGAGGGAAPAGGRHPRQGTRLDAPVRRGPPRGGRLDLAARLTPAGRAGVRPRGAAQALRLPGGEAPGGERRAAYSGRRTAAGGGPSGSSSLARQREAALPKGGGSAAWCPVRLSMSMAATSRSLTLRCWDAARRIANASSLEMRFWPMITPSAWSIVLRELRACSRCSARSVCSAISRQRRRARAASST